VYISRLISGNVRSSHIGVWNNLPTELRNTGLTIGTFLWTSENCTFLLREVAAHLWQFDFIPFINILTYLQIIFVDAWTEKWFKLHIHRSHKMIIIEFIPCHTVVTSEALENIKNILYYRVVQRHNHALFVLTLRLRDIDISSSHLTADDILYGNIKRKETEAHKHLS